MCASRVLLGLHHMPKWCLLDERSRASKLQTCKLILTTQRTLSFEINPPLPGVPVDEFAAETATDGFAKEVGGRLKLAI
jgi:hypothetical protein